MNAIKFWTEERKTFGGSVSVFAANVMSEHGKVTVTAPTLEALAEFVQDIETRQGRGPCQLVKE